MLPCFEMMQSHALLQPFISNHCCKLAMEGFQLETFQHEGDYKLWGKLLDEDDLGEGGAKEVLEEFLRFISGRPLFRHVAAAKVSVDFHVTIVVYLTEDVDLWGAAAAELSHLLKEFGVVDAVKGGWWYQGTEILQIY